MSSGFYQLLGVEPSSSAARIRSAYGQALSRLNKERRERLADGAPVEGLDRRRGQLDAAWEVLSDPVRRRRYNALLAWQAGSRPTDPDAVWAAVGEALVHPAAQVAARLLRVTSHLPEIGELPRAPSGAAVDPATLVPHDDDLTTPRVPDPPTGGADARRHLRLVSSGGAARRSDPGSSGAVIAFPEPRTPKTVSGPAHRTPTSLPADEVAILVEQLDHSGALLKAVRERMGITLRAMAERTRISEVYLTALEAEDAAALPTVTFVRGYVREVARVLDLDADVVVAGYMRRHRQER